MVNENQSNHGPSGIELDSSANVERIELALGKLIELLDIVGGGEATTEFAPDAIVAGAIEVVRGNLTELSNVVAGREVSVRFAVSSFAAGAHITEEVAVSRLQTAMADGTVTSTPAWKLKFPTTDLR